MANWMRDFTIQPPLQFGNISFSPHHPFFNGMGKVGSSSFINELPHPSFTKLCAWLKRHTDSTKYCYFYVSDKQINPEFRYFGLKSQIIEGHHIIGKLEETRRATLTTVSSSVKNFPFSQLLKDLEYVKKEWHTVRVSDYLTNVLKAEENKIIKQKYQQQINIVESLESLITSIDAIPVNYFPIIDFKAIEDDAANIKDERMNQIRQCIISIQGEYRLACVGIESCGQKYRQSIEIQDTYKNIVKEFAMKIDYQSQAIKNGADTSEFCDLVLHPNSPTRECAMEFINQKDCNSFWKLTTEINKCFCASEAYAPIIYALCTAEFAQHGSPEILFDGCDLKFDDTTLELLCTFDPMAIVSLMNSNGVERCIESIKCVTSDWHKILKFAVDFTDENRMNAAMKETRRIMAESMSCLI